MTTDQGAVAFEAFYRAHAPGVFDLALRHGGDHRVAADCVDSVFEELRAHWARVTDPLRFCRRAAVLFVCRARNAHARHVAHRARAGRLPGDARAHGRTGHDELRLRHGVDRYPVPPR